MQRLYFRELKKVFEQNIDIPSKAVGIGGSIRTLSKNDYG